MKDSYFILLQKLNNFIERYYRFKIIKGIMLFFTLAFGIVLLESVYEYYFFNSIVLRRFIFFASIIIFLIIFIYYILIPILSLLKIGNRLNFKEASQIISQHFDLVDDNLINTIELGQNITLNHDKTDLLIASIEQRTQLLNPLPFNFAISTKSLKSSVIYFTVGFFIIISIFSFAPAIFKEGTYRIIDYNNYYEPKAPFRFVIENSNLLVKKGDDLNLNVLVKGNYIPDKVSIIISGNSFLMKRDKENRNSFKFKINNLNNSISIFFIADTYKSKSYNINVLPAPVLKNFIIEVFPPKYTGIEYSILKNSGDINIPFGSIVKWKFQANFVDTLFMNFVKDTTICLSKNNIFSHKRRIIKSGMYSIDLINKNFTLNSDISYQINLIPDLFPEISVNSVEDSLTSGIFYYMVNVKDDYGFTKLLLNYRIIDSNQSDEKFISTEIKLNNQNTNQDVFYKFDFSKFNLKNEDNFIEYYFVIFDNDFISGFKSTKSKINTYKPFSRKEIENKIKEHENKTNDNLEESKKLVHDIKKEIEDFKRKEINNELSDWEKKIFLKSVSKKQNELNNLLEKIKQENEQKNTLNNQLHSENKEILKKQAQIQKILNELMDQELLDLLKEIEELREKFNSKDFDKLKEKMNFSYEDLEKDLDKSLELLKRFQLEEKVQNLSEDIKKLSVKQNDLSEKIYKKSDRENQQLKQNRVDDRFKDLEEEFKKTLEKNKNLKRPYKLNKFEKDFENIKEKLENISDDIEKKSSKKINEQRNDASESMKKLAQKMQKMIEEMSSKSLNMSLQDLRQIIENLNKFSFSQEEVYLTLNKIFSNDPKFVDLVKIQFKLCSDFELIEDSLNSLATRVPQMSKLIGEELNSLNYSLNKTLSEFELRHRRATLRYQRNVINSTNKLALYLEELNDQLQNQQSQSSSGKGDQKKPANSMQKLKQQQEGLKQQLEQLLKELKKDGGKKNGKGVNKGVVKSLAEQEIFNKMLKEMQNSEGISPQTSKQLKEIKRLSDKNIDDLINKNITQDLLNRNENIRTRLLESEKSEREREKEKIRESNEGKDQIRKFPKEIEDFLKRNNKHKETLQKNNIHLKKYFQNLSNEYYQRIK